MFMSIINLELEHKEQDKRNNIDDLFKAPAFPPQLMMNNFNQLIAPVPGQSNLLNIAAGLLPAFIKIYFDSGLYEEDKDKTFAWPVHNAMVAAMKLLEEYNEMK